MIPLTIIICAYNRADALRELFSSLAKLSSPQPVNLVISIDNKGTDAVNKIANEYYWHLGEKDVVIHQEKKGLIKHFIWIGDQTEKYEHVLFLEDDMYVSPNMLNYVLQMIPFFENDDRVAGAALYNTPFTLNYMPFPKLETGFDNFFFQHPYWGNVWFKNKWRMFKAYLNDYQPKENLLPKAVIKWREHSFKRMYLQYLIETGRTIVTPYRSLVTNNSIPGIHASAALFAQTPFEIVALPEKEYNFQSLDDSIAIYDAMEEVDVNVIKRLNPEMAKYDFVMDTKLNHTTYDKPYILTTLKPKEYITSFYSAIKPLEANVILNIKDGGLYLCRKEDVVRKKYDYLGLFTTTIMSHVNIQPRQSLSIFLNLLKQKISWFKI